MLNPFPNILDNNSVLEDIHTNSLTQTKILGESKERDTRAIMKDTHTNSPIQTTVLGEINISPPLSLEEKDFLLSYIETTHYDDDTLFDHGLYYVDQPKVENVNIEPNLTKKSYAEIVDTVFSLSRKNPLELTPSLECPLKIIQDNKTFEFNALSISPKHLERISSPFWLLFLIEHFFKENCFSKTISPQFFSFFKTHNLNGEIWFKTGRKWDTQKISVQDNCVFVSHSNIPVQIKGKFQNKTIFVNKFNHLSLLSEHVAPTQIKDEYSKKYYEMKIKDIADLNDTTKEYPIILPQSDLLDQILFNAHLKNTLVNTITTNNKPIKI